MRSCLCMAGPMALHTVGTHQSALLVQSGCDIQSRHLLGEAFVTTGAVSSVSCPGGRLFRVPRLPLPTPPPFPSPLPLPKPTGACLSFDWKDTTNLLSVSMDLLVLDCSHKWDPIICGLFHWSPSLYVMPPLNCNMSILHSP